MCCRFEADRTTGACERGLDACKVVSVQRKNSGACKMNGFAVDVNDGATADVEVIETLAKARELLMNQPALELFDSR